MPATKLERLMTERDLAELTQRQVRTIQKDRLLGKGPKFVKIGRSVRYLPADVAEYLNSRPCGGETL
jgi:hypothetical protein